MDVFRLIAERKIQEAADQGFFDDLALKGQPLHLEELLGMPEDLRMAFKVMKDAGMLPEEMHLKKEISTLGELIASTQDEDLKLQWKAQMRELRVRYEILMEKRVRR